MKILIIGGTVFLGRYLVENALRKGHEVTLFNRGIHNPELFPEVEKLRGDRYEDLSALEGRSWDAAIDVNCFIPSSVGALAQKLANSVQHYTFVSSKSAYGEFYEPEFDETKPVLDTLTPAQQAQVTELIQTPEGRTSNELREFYGQLKALSEQAAEAALPGRVLHVRSGLLVGPHDYSDRFTYWPRRISQGGEILAPGDPKRGIQFIDVRDIATWIIHMIEQNQTGIYNANGPAKMINMGDFLNTCKTVLGSDATFTWLDEAFLLEANAGPWIEVPLWLPEQGEYLGFFAGKNDKAVAHGLSMRPLADTIRDTLAWDTTRPVGTTYNAGLTHERETELLQAWHKR